MAWDAGPPVGAEVGGVARRAGFERFLVSGGREAHSGAVDVEQVTDGVVLAWGRPAEGVGGHLFHERDHAEARRFEVELRGHRPMRRAGRWELIAGTR